MQQRPSRSFTFGHDAGLPRREFLLQAVAAGGATFVFTRPGRAAGAVEVPVRQLTHGPQHHWFGYYDKFQFDVSGRWLLTNQVDFEHRSPTADDTIRVGLVDRENPGAFREMGRTQAWGWQQGCMLQWLPGSEDEVIWNERADDHFAARILNVSTGESRLLAAPIYCLTPDGTTAFTTDFRRIQDMRPGYGYAGLADPFRDQTAPADSGLWSLDVKSGEQRLLVSLQQVAETEPDETMQGAKHWMNHLLASPDGRRVIFLHRWIRQGVDRSFHTRMYTVDVDGRNLFLLDPSGKTSHFIWRDPEHICAWTQPIGQPPGFYLFRDQSREVIPVGRDVMTVNGHNTYLNVGDGRTWILNDTYPDRGRMQTVYLYHVPSGARLDLARLPAPPAYTGEWRCDTHPRSSRDGRWVCVDSPAENEGRQLFLLDLEPVLQRFSGA